jgi:hypothetical protein
MAVSKIRTDDEQLRTTARLFSQQADDNTKLLSALRNDLDVLQGRRLTVSTTPTPTQRNPLPVDRITEVSVLDPYS